MAEDETSTPKELDARLEDAYFRFAGLQQQKLVMLAYVSERQAEIDHPKTGALSVLTERYPHIDREDIRTVLEHLEPVVSIVQGGPTDDDSQLAAFLEDQIPKCEEILDDGYVFACLHELLSQTLRTKLSGGDSEDFRASLFTGLIADFEAFIVALLTELYREHPGKLQAAGKAVTWATLLEIEDLDAFRDQCIEDAVVETMRGSAEDWMTALKADHGLDVGTHASSDAFVEMFQRRHVLVHNGGRASRLYLQKVPKSTCAPGERLGVDEAYFATAADRLAVVALTLTVRALLQLSNRDNLEVERLTADWIYELLLRRRYVAVDEYAASIPVDRMQNASAVQVIKVNWWLALKRLGRFEECREAVETWQVGHLGRTFHLAKLALLDEIKNASQLCVDLLSTGELPRRHWIEWPLLEDVRAHAATNNDLGDTDGGPTPFVGTV